jgi:molybdopterin-guanine dinucleotide biosynthesis protein A
MSDQTIAGAILAGGQARRFGGLDKSRLTGSDGRPIIVRQLELLQRVAGSLCIVTTVADRQSRPDRFVDLGVPITTDVFPDAGALGGIHAALSHATATSAHIDRVMVVACDLPSLTLDLLLALSSLARQDDGAWVRSRRGPEPLIACYRLHALPRITAMLDGGERRAHALGEMLTLGELGPDALAVFGDPDTLTANVNTPEEWRRVQ